MELLMYLKAMERLEAVIPVAIEEARDRDGGNRVDELTVRLMSIFEDEEPSDCVLAFFTILSQHTSLWLEYDKHRDEIEAIAAVIKSRETHDTGSAGAVGGRVH